MAEQQPMLKTKSKTKKLPFTASTTDHLEETNKSDAEILTYLLSHMRRFVQILTFSSHITWFVRFLFLRTGIFTIFALICLFCIWFNQPCSGKLILCSSLVCLFCSKLLNVFIPVLLKQAVDEMIKYFTLLHHVSYHNETLAIGHELENPVPTQPWATELQDIYEVAFRVILTFVMVRIISEFLNEARNYLFAKVSVMSIRLVSQKLFTKLLDLPLAWHLSKKTGSVIKSIDRGTRGAKGQLSFSCFWVDPESNLI